MICVFIFLMLWLAKVMIHGILVTSLTNMVTHYQDSDMLQMQFIWSTNVCIMMRCSIIKCQDWSLYAYVWYLRRCTIIERFSEVFYFSTIFVLWKQEETLLLQFAYESMSKSWCVSYLLHWSKISSRNILM